MKTQEEVREIARKVKEAANDWRFLEVAGLFFDAEDVSGAGDTGAGRYDDYRGVAAGDRIEHVQSQQSATLGTEFDWVIDHFELYARIDSGPYDEMLAALDAVRESLNGVEEHVGDIQSRFQLTDWEGPFATNLQDNLFSPLESVKINQINIIKELQASVQGHWSLVVAARQSVWEIGEATRAHLQSLIDTQKEDPNEAIMPIIGAVLAVGGIAAAIPTGGASLAVLPMALAVAGTATATATAVVAVKDEMSDDPDRDKSVFSAGFQTSAIMSEMLQQMLQLDEYIAEEERKLSSKLMDTYGEIEAWLGDTTGEKSTGVKARAWHLQAFRSELADQTPDANDMSHP